MWRRCMGIASDGRNDHAVSAFVLVPLLRHQPPVSLNPRGSVNFRHKPWSMSSVLSLRFHPHPRQRQPGGKRNVYPGQRRRIAVVHRWRADHQ